MCWKNCQEPLIDYRPKNERLSLKYKYNHYVTYFIQGTIKKGQG